MEKEGRKQTPNPLWVCASGLGSQTGSIPEPSSLPLWQECFGPKAPGHLALGKWGSLLHQGWWEDVRALSCACGPSIPSPGVTAPPCASLLQPELLMACGCLILEQAEDAKQEQGEGLRAPPHSSDRFPTWISSGPASGVGYQLMQVDPRTEVTRLGTWGSLFPWGFMGAPATGCVHVAKHCHLLLALLFFLLHLGQCASCPAPARAAHGSSSWSGQWMQSCVGRGSDTISSLCRPSPQLCPGLCGWLSALAGWTLKLKSPLRDHPRTPSQMSHPSTLSPLSQSLHMGDTWGAVEKPKPAVT